LNAFEGEIEAEEPGLRTSQANALGRYSQLIIVIIANLQIDMKLISAPWTWMLDWVCGYRCYRFPILLAQTGLLCPSVGLNEDAETDRENRILHNILILFNKNKSLYKNQLLITKKKIFFPASLILSKSHI